MAEADAATGASGIGPLGYLALRSGLNLLRRRLARLGEPRYALSALAGLLYIGFWLSQAFLFRVPNGAGLRGAPDASGTGPLLVLLLGGGAALAWLWPGRSAPLRFSETEIHWLFAGPFPRPLLVLYKIAARIPGTALSAVFFGLWRLVAGGGPGAWLRTTAGFFVLFFTLDLHAKLAGLVRLGARERGLRDGWFSLLALAVLGTLLLVVLWPLLGAQAPDGSWIDAAARVQRGPGAILLRPLVWLAEPLAAGDTASFLRSLPAALGLLFLHIGALLSIRVSFEESAVDFWMRSTRGRAGAGEPSGSVAGPQLAPRQPFRLDPEGPAELAIAWKNLIAMGRIFSTRSLSIAGLVAVVAALLPRVFPDQLSGTAQLHGLAARLALLLAALVLLVGPSMLRSDLRFDLVNLDILRTLPLSGARLLLAEMLAPLLVLTSIEGILLVVAAGSPEGHVMPRPLLLSLAIVAPGLLALSLLVQNAVVVYFPAWALPGPDSGRGIGGVGQGMLASIGRTLVLLVAYAPAVSLALGVWVAGRAFGLPFAGSLAALGALSVLLVETLLGIHFVARRLEATEPGEDTRRE